MTDRYLTLASEAVAEIEVKRSRFLCSVRRVESEEEARAFVEDVRRRHWDARHNCSAFVIGPDGGLARSNDDGEPAGTAGAPMLDVLRGVPVSDCVAVVTRYFGGVLLGAGGLVRAYGDAVRAAVDAAGLIERRLVDLYEVVVPLADAGRLENDLRTRGVTVRDVRYGEQARFTLAAGADLDVVAVLAEISGGAVTPERRGTDWVDAR